MSANTPPNPAVSRPNAKGGRKLGQSVQPPETRSEWLEPLLVAAKAGVAAGETCPIPYIKGAFSIVVLLLETVQKMKKNRDALKDLCDNTVKLMDIIQHQIVSRQGTAAGKLIELCKEFENLMKDILQGVKQMQARAENTRGKLREFFKSDTIAEQVSGYEKKIKTFLDHIQLVANLDNNNQLHAIVTGGILLGTVSLDNHSVS
ncbi:hypothetical protein FB451DRAFT_1398326 [Mycena latifolia]|nr:hypothetical protein FB451DRAFT_1398326 [Mycena latifolia]